MNANFQQGSKVFGKVALATAALAGMLAFAGAPSALANDDGCRRRIIKADHKLHEAIEMVETSEAPDHQIVGELQCGYKIKDRLLRPAMVRVARNRS